jgi:uncharacterized protein YecT (DUF1311 family)
MKLFSSAFLILMSLHVANYALASDCANPTSQTDMSLCTANDLDRETKKINQTYNSVRAKLNPKQKQDFKAVQLAWIKFKDADCKFQSSAAEGGSAYPMIVSACLMSKTVQRNKELDHLLNCQEGDLSCPAH